MSYPNCGNIEKQAGMLSAYAHRKHEYGAQGIQAVIEKLEKQFKEAVAEIEGLPDDPALAAKEPNDLPSIHALRPAGPRRMWASFNKALYPDKIAGAWLGRLAGNVLGDPVEGWSVKDMKNWAEYTGMDFPPTAYWKKIKRPGEPRGHVNRFEDYTASGINGAPADDDTAYTILGMLIAEDYGVDFTIDDVGRAWLKYLPFAATAEDIALHNLMDGVDAQHAADIGNPYTQWIGADIRSDPWGYIAPGWPEKAAELAYRDAYISHRRAGIYGAMYFAAAIAAAFAADTVQEALEIGLTEIPAECALYEDIAWALSVSDGVRDYKDARQAVDDKMKGMHPVHTNNNAALTVFGLTIGGTDVTRVIAETVAMGMDNDCTAATAGSIAGAVGGLGAISPHWYEPYNDTLYSYIKGHPKFSIRDMCRRFGALAEQLHKTP